MNNIRLGFTESTLLFLWFLDNKNINIDNNLYINEKKSGINWLYSTSGFYDKTISGSYFNYNFEEVIKSKTYNNYFERLFNFLKNNNNFELQLYFHNTNDKLLPYKEEFLNIVKNNKYPAKTDIHTFMKGKNILIINNLGSLMKKQFESGNIHKINPNFPNDVKSIQYFENGYSFINNGPDSCILETSEKLCNEISKFEFDAAIISSGAYSYLFSEFILNNLKKQVFVIGGDLPVFFGIKTKRATMFCPQLINEYFIEVPPEMKPLNYEKIEGGAYW